MIKEKGLTINVEHPTPSYHVFDGQEQLGKIEFIENRGWEFMIAHNWPRLSEQPLRFIADKIKSLS